MKIKIEIFFSLILIYIIFIIIICFCDFNKTKFTWPEKFDFFTGDGGDDSLAHLQRINLNYQLEFELALNKSCNPKNLTLNNFCLSEIHKIDTKFATLKKKTIKNYTKSSECQTKNETLNFHTFWQLNASSSLGFRMLNLNVMSFLATQNLECSKLTLWVLEHFPKQLRQQLISKFTYYLDTNVFEIRNLKIDELCTLAIREQTNFAKSQICSKIVNSAEIRNKHLISLSDFVRFFVLDIFGGIYTDGDVIFLKDMSILAKYNFAYRWSSTNDYNTAVMGINGRLNMEKTKDLYDLFIRESTTIDQLINKLHPIRLTKLVVNNRNNVSIFDLGQLNSLLFVAMHSGLFDPAWLCNDKKVPRASERDVCVFKEFTSSKLMNEEEFKAEMFFAGAFTYHFHLSTRSNLEINNQSYFKYFENYFNRVFKL